MVALGFASMICFPFLDPLSGYDSNSEPAFDSKAFISGTSDYLAQHSLVLRVELLWNSPVSHVLLHLHGVVLFLQLQRVVLGRPNLDWSFVMWFGGAFSLLWIHRYKVSLLLFKLLPNLYSIPIHCVERGNVQELHVILDVLV